MIPDLPEAQALYAIYLLEEKGYSEAVTYLEEKMDGTGTDAGLLIGIVQIQNRSKRTKDAAQTLPRQEPEAPGVARLTAGLGAKFDPRGIFNAEALALTP